MFWSVALICKVLFFLIWTAPQNSNEKEKQTFNPFCDFFEDNINQEASQLQAMVALWLIFKAIEMQRPQWDYWRSERIKNYSLSLFSGREKKCMKACLSWILHSCGNAVKNQESFTNPCIQFIQHVVKNCVVCLIKHRRHVLLFHIESAGQQIDLMVQRINMKQGPYAASCAWMFMRPEPGIQ